MPREILYQIRDMTIIVRNRKLKPEKGGAKGLVHRGRYSQRRCGVRDRIGHVESESRRLVPARLVAAGIRQIAERDSGRQFARGTVNVELVPIIWPYANVCG